MSMDDELEQALREALRRPSPSPGFTARVLARAAREGRRPRRWGLLAVPQPGWAVAALLLVAVAGGAARYERHREGERAKEQVMTALRITGAKLELARAKVQQVGVD
jgi:hypothetical protein